MREDFTGKVVKWLKDGHNLRQVEENVLKSFAILKHVTYIDQVPEDVLNAACKASAAAALTGAFALVTGIVDPALGPYVIQNLFAQAGALLCLGIKSTQEMDRIIQHLDLKTPAELMTQNLNDSLKGVVEKRMAELIERSHPLQSLVKGITQKFPVSELVERILLQDSKILEQRLDHALQASMLETLDDLKKEFKELIEVLQENRLELIADGVFRVVQAVDHKTLVTELLAEIGSMYATGHAAKLILNGAVWTAGCEALAIVGDPLDWAAKMIFMPPSSDAGLFAKLLYEGRKTAIVTSAGAAIKYTPVTRSVLKDVSRLHSQGTKKIEEISKLKGKVDNLLNMLGLSRSSLADLIAAKEEKALIIANEDAAESSDPAVEEVKPRDKVDSTSITPEEKLFSAISEAVLGLDVTTETDPQVAAFLARSFDLIFPVFVGFLGEVGQELGKDIRFSSLKGALSFALACMRKPNEPAVKAEKRSVFEMIPRPTSGNIDNLKAKSGQLFAAAFKQFYFHLTREITIQVKEELERQKQGVKDSLVVWNRGVDDYYKAQGEMIQQLGVSEDLTSSIISFLSYPNRKGRELLGMLFSLGQHEAPPEIQSAVPEIVVANSDQKEADKSDQKIPENADSAAIAMFEEIYKGLTSVDQEALEKDVDILFSIEDVNVSEIFAKLQEVNQADEHYTKKLLAVMLANKFAPSYEPEAFFMGEDDFRSSFDEFLAEHAKIEAHIERYHLIRNAINECQEGLGGWTAAANLAAPGYQAIVEQKMIELISQECAPVANKAGGDCLPLSFIQGTKINTEVSDLRSEIADYMWNNRSSFQEIVRQFLEAPSQEFDQELFRQYLSLVVRADVVVPGTTSNYWGSPELQALCDFSKRNIVLVAKREDGTSYLMIYKPKISEAAHPALFLNYHDMAFEGTRHYEAYQHRFLFEEVKVTESEEAKVLTSEEVKVPETESEETTVSGSEEGLRQRKINSEIDKK